MNTIIIINLILILLLSFTTIILVLNISYLHQRLKIFEYAFEQFSQIIKSQNDKINSLQIKLNKIERKYLKKNE